METSHLHLISKNQEVRNLVAPIAKQHGYHLQQSSDLQHALAAMANVSPQLTIIDKDQLQQKETEVLIRLLRSEFCCQFLLIQQQQNQSLSLIGDELNRYLEKAIHARQSLSTSQLREALLKDQLQLHYQPKICLESQQVLGAEVLLRWDHPKLGMLPAAQIITLAQQADMATDLDRWVLQHTCKQFARWHRRYPSLTLAVNLESSSLLRGDFIHFLQDAMHNNQLLPQQLTLEIPATILENLALYETSLTQLASAGFKITLDNFAAMAIDLPTLAKLPINELKIDREYLLGMGQLPNSKKIIRAIVGLAHGMNLKVSAAALETAAHWEFLTEIGCDYGQGFYISRPVTAEEISKWFS